MESVSPSMMTAEAQKETERKMKVHNRAQMVIALHMWYKKNANDEEKMRWDDQKKTEAALVAWTDGGEKSPATFLDRFVNDRNIDLENVDLDNVKDIEKLSDDFEEYCTIQSAA